MKDDFDKIRCNNCTIYIRKDFRNIALEKILSAQRKELQRHDRLTSVPSSEFTRVYKSTISFDGVDRVIYFKQYLPRSVFDFVKNFFYASRAQRAFEGTLVLRKNGFDAPPIVAIGRCKFGFFHTKDFLAMPEVEDSKQIYRFFPNSLDNLTKDRMRSKRDLIRAFGRTIGKMHAKGIFHGDLRLGNVLVQQGKNCWRFFFLDNERTKKFRRLPAQLQLKNLVQVNMNLPDILTNTDRMRFFKEYWAENGSGKSKKEKIALIKKILKRTNQRLGEKKRYKRNLRKCLRTNERYLRIKTGRNLALFNRVFCQGDETIMPVDFIQQMDTLMDKGQIFKNDNTCYVSRFTWNGQDIVVKRYNHKGIIHSLRHTIKKSRARRSWLHSHRLIMLRISTPKPLAYVEQRNAMLVWKSYFVTKYIEGQKLKDFLRDNRISKEKRLRVAQQIAEILDKLGKYKITHGDLKHSNILITDDGPIITDLDSMKAHKWNLMYKIRKAKDLVHFENN